MTTCGPDTLERVTQALVDCFAAEQDSRFAAGDVLNALPEKQSLKVIASQVGRSVSFLSSLRQVSRTFPQEQRAQDQSWSLHLLAARTTDPAYFLEAAISNAWSVRELREHLVNAGEVKGKEAKDKTCPQCGCAL